MSKLKRPSLTLQLLAAIGAPFLIVIALIGVIAYLSAEDEISEVYDSQLISSAQQLWKLTRNDDNMSQLRIDEKDPNLDKDEQHALDDYGRWRTYRVWRQNRLIITSDAAASSIDAPLHKGLVSIKTSTGDWRVFTFVVPADHMTIEVSERLDARREVSLRVVWGVTLPLLCAFPIIVLMVWLAIRWGLRDLRRFAGDIQSRTPDDLSRVGNDTLPAEIAPVAEAVDQLLDKLERSSAQERLFTDNAAHELRTPLAALSVQADVIRNAKTKAEREAMINELSGGVVRAGRLLDQLLMLARVRHAPVETAAFDLVELATEVIKDNYQKARAKGMSLSLGGAEAASVTTNSAFMALILGNLLDNAIKYAPENTAVEVTIARQGSTVSLEVRDQGPGIPKAERQHVFTRFYRLKGHTESGSGLGLSIVKTLSELLGAEVQLITPDNGRGLAVKVQLAQ
jgi:signal transduction histidine kinase